jgi:hypothetical protein
MAELVGVFAASHTPVMLNFPEAIPDAEREAIFGAFKHLGNELRRAAPQCLVVVSDDHLHNFFLNNFPAFCIGAAESYPTPVEHWLKADKTTLQGDADFGAHLLATALHSGFDPSFSMELTLDHGVLTPLHLAGLRPRAHRAAAGQLRAAAAADDAACTAVGSSAAAGRGLVHGLRAHRGAGHRRHQPRHRDAAHGPGQRGLRPRVHAPGGGRR